MIRVLQVDYLQSIFYVRATHFWTLRILNTLTLSDAQIIISKTVLCLSQPFG